MSIETEINRIRTNVSGTLSAISEMGGEVPEGATSDDMASGVRSIPVGAKIDDTTPSTSTTYSSSKIESEINKLNGANAAQDTEIAKKANDAELAKVAKSGSYNDLTNKPTIPTVPSTLPNPNALTFTGAVNETYDGSAARSVAIPTVPTALKNPNKLTFKGAVTAEYDGSATVEVTIPEGGSGGTSGNYMPVNNNYVSDANSVTTTQITKTDNSTLNLPNEITSEKWGVIQFVAENDSKGNGTQMYWPIDSAYAGRMYIRGHNNKGWTEWKRYATTSEIPTVPEALKNPNKLTFTGAVTAEYDGSAPVSVEIPAVGGSEYTLPVASPTTLGGVMPAAKTGEMTQAVGVDEAGGLWALPGGGDTIEPTLPALIVKHTLTEAEATAVKFEYSVESYPELANYTDLLIEVKNAENSLSKYWFSIVNNEKPYKLDENKVWPGKGCGNAHIKIKNGYFAMGHSSSYNISLSASDSEPNCMKIVPVFKPIVGGLKTVGVSSWEAGWLSAGAMIRVWGYNE